VAPPQGQTSPTRSLIALGAIFVVLFSLVFFGGHGAFKDHFAPKLGLDLAGGTQLTLQATSPNGEQPSADNLELARQIIENRVNGLGVAEAEVVTAGNDEIVVSAPGNSSDTLQQVGKPAQLRFRKVLNSISDSPDATPATPSPGASGSPSPGATASPAAVAPTTTPAPAPTTTAAAAAPSGSASPSPSPNHTQALQKSITDKLGADAIQAAQALAASPPSDLSTITSDQATMAKLEPFRKLTPEEISILPTDIQFYIPQITCAKLNARPAGSIVDMNQQAVACQDKSDTKLMLDKSSVQGTDVSGAQANIDTTAGGAWKVDLTFSSEGAGKWQKLTQEALNNTDGACNAAVTQPRTDGQGQTCEVAVVMDNVVVSAPAIQGVLSTQSQITGGFNQTSATLLANQLKYGALPLTFQPVSISQVSATLGTDYLRAGLLAAGIGLLLVVVYAFFYYRLLGLVITLSLVLSAMLTFLMLVFLGRQIGFTLSLAGIAGFIVSLGVAADSFVIYFERLKDEIREGRSPRSAVSRAWTRARRTIITANVVTVMAAVVLYVIGISSVKGFAFALGMATILDLVIVFLFRHPMMTMLARSPAFLSPRVSGLGRVLQHASKDDTPAPSGPRRPKEA
jgi:preprotein translocase subunit SecD